MFSIKKKIRKLLSEARVANLQQLFLGLFWGFWKYLIWLLNTIFDKVDLKISNNTQIYRILAYLPAEKVFNNSANFWVIRNFHINLYKSLFKKNGKSSIFLKIFLKKISRRLSSKFNALISVHCTTKKIKTNKSLKIWNQFPRKSVHREKKVSAILCINVQKILRPQEALSLTKKIL